MHVSLSGLEISVKMLVKYVTVRFQTQNDDDFFSLILSGCSHFKKVIPHPDLSHIEIWHKNLVRLWIINHLHINIPLILLY